MENVQHKLCKDCKYHSKNEFAGYGCDSCTQRIFYTTDVVTGKKIKNGHSINCYTNRDVEGGAGWCGAKGKFWEQKQSLFSKILSYFRS
jgi:hypothetical protein